jgi:hypothetical protein
LFETRLQPKKMDHRRSLSLRDSRRDHARWVWVWLFTLEGPTQLGPPRHSGVCSPSCTSFAERYGDRAAAYRSTGSFWMNLNSLRVFQIHISMTTKRIWSSQSAFDLFYSTCCFYRLERQHTRTRIETPVHAGARDTEELPGRSLEQGTANEVLVPSCSYLVALPSHPCDNLKSQSKSKDDKSLDGECWTRQKRPRLPLGVSKAPCLVIRAART